jgi:hypothetical protein
MEMSEGLEDFSSSDTTTAENLALAVRIISRNLNEIFINLDHMIFEPDPQTSRWFFLARRSA